MSEEARKMSQAISSANRDLVQQTKHFEKELHSLESAHLQAQKERREMNKNIREEKRRIRNHYTQHDYLNLIATPDSTSRRAESIKSFGTVKTQSRKQQLQRERVHSPNLLPRSKKKKLSGGGSSSIRLPEIVNNSRNQLGSFNTITPGMSR